MKRGLFGRGRAPHEAWELPHRLGSYQLIERIARGGMAVIYLAQEAGSNRRGPLRAVKCLHQHLAEQPEQLRRFEREGRILRALRHPNLVRGLEAGEAEGVRFIVMERLEGQTLAEVMVAAGAEGLPTPLLAQLVGQASRGLQAAHDLPHPSGRPWELVHGDVSPQNVMVTPSGRVVVLDFGLARSGRSEPHPPEAPPGKLAYLSPEQLLGRPVDRRADVFALGVILWEAVARRRLFKRADDGETRRRIVEHKVEPPSRYAPELPRRLEAVIIQALRLEPEGRFQSATELAEALEDPEVSPGDGEALSRWVRQRLEG
jgi:serine/threonine-protein kinase